MDKVLGWLLEPSDPAVRHATLTTLLGRSSDDREVRKARAAIMEADPVKTMLAHQQPEGYWGEPARFYESKYRGTIWQVIFMAQLGAPADERIRRACEFIFRWSQNRKTNGFRNHGSASYGGHAGALPCLTGNVVWAFQRLGYADDARWRRAVGWLLAEQMLDGGWGHPKDGTHNTHSCFQGSIKALMALTSARAVVRDPAIGQSIRRACEFFLQHRLFRRDHHGFDVAKPQFLRFGFPLGWQTDVLDMLDVITEAGVTGDERLADAVATVLAKRDESSRWRLENTYNARKAGGMWCDIETKDAPSKWITLKALRALRRIGAERVAQFAKHGGRSSRPAVPRRGGGPPPSSRKRH
jgi:hypothetical protein